MSKQYGLIKPGQKQSAAKPATQAVQRPSIFDEGSSSDSDNAAGPPTRAKAGTSTNGPSIMERRMARHMQEKALAEDPTIFQYDELYDEMETKRTEAKETKSKEPRKAKYIGRLLEHAERRKLENELRFDRQVQKEREAEGEQFKDKETYVTAAYRKKLESIKQVQEKEQRDDYLEAIGDVTKQKDLDGFYRHLYEQKLGDTKPKTDGDSDGISYKPIRAEAKPEAVAAPKTAGTTSKQRSYRRRKTSQGDSDEEEKQKQQSDAAPQTTPPSTSKVHLPNNIDADSDFSIDESSDEEERSQAAPKAAIDPSNDVKKQPIEAPEPATTAEAPAEPEEKSEPVTPKEKKERNINIWEKRTVGSVFDEALARYQQRKLTRYA